MPEVRSRPRLAAGTALAAAGVVLVFLALTSPAQVYGTASVEDASSATVEPSGSASQSLGVAGGILVAAGIGVALLAFTDFGKAARR